MISCVQSNQSSPIKPALSNCPRTTIIGISGRGYNKFSLLILQVFLLPTDQLVESTFLPWRQLTRKSYQATSASANIFFYRYNVFVSPDDFEVSFLNKTGMEAALSSERCTRLAVTSPLIDENFSTNFTFFDDLISSVISFVSIKIDKYSNNKILSFRCDDVKQGCAN